MLQKTWYMMGRLIVQQYVKHVLKADVHREAVVPRGPKIIVANHPSTSDPAFVTTLVKEQTSILILETLFKVPLFGRSLRMAGHVPVHPGNGKTALEEGARLLKMGRTVIIFPEGSISPAAGGFQKAHTGAARLALMTGVPVVPVGISLDPQRLRVVQTQVDGKSEKGTWYLDGPYAMTVGKAMSFQGQVDDREQVHAVTGQIMQEIGLLSAKGSYRLKSQIRKAGLARQALRHANHWYKYSATLRFIQSSLLFMMLFTRHF